jgi:hypothetical protein
MQSVHIKLVTFFWDLSCVLLIVSYAFLMSSAFSVLISLDVYI